MIDTVERIACRLFGHRSDYPNQRLDVVICRCGARWTEKKPA